MLCSRSLLLAAFMGAVVLLGGCSTSPMSRIDSNRALYESWPLEVQQAVLEGRVIEGMTYEQVEMSVGKPAEKTARNTRKGSEEIWVYKSGGGGPGVPITVGTVVGGVGVQKTTGGGGYQETSEVVFVEGQVVRSTLPQ
jgi:hypothetical protein